ncbi:MAG: IS4 family transposase [Kangiellaceae bacterium]|nr:IS4 family transposase [Kangiellaceae bacterium]
MNKFLMLVTPNMHQYRRNSVSACINSIMHGASATVTSIGRGIHSQSYEKNDIKRADRLLSNSHLLTELPDIYAEVSGQFIHHVNQPVIHIDWSDLDPYKRHFLIRASTKFSGRSLVIYQEVHSIRTKEKPATHKRFLEKLKNIIGDKKQPIIVTDAGFKTPWFREVDSLGWYFVGRSRKPNFYRTDEHEWQCITTLYPQARTTPKLIQGEINRSKPFHCHLILYKQKPKGRHSINRIGKRRHSKRSNAYAKRSNDPWLLCSSLPANRKLAKKVVAIYRTRMQIEEEFRDMKSRQYGLGLGENKTKDRHRLSVLIFLASFANIVLTIVGLIIHTKNEHRHYQANTIKNRRVLSFQTLGLRSILSKRFRAKLEHFNKAIEEIKVLVDGLEYC